MCDIVASYQEALSEVQFTWQGGVYDYDGLCDAISKISGPAKTLIGQSLHESFLRYQESAEREALIRDEYGAVLDRAKGHDYTLTDDQNHDVIAAAKRANTRRDRKRGCRTKILKYFKDDAFFQFLLSKYKGHNVSTSWWKETGLAIDYIMNALGASNVSGPDVVKKAFSDALLEKVRSGEKNEDLIIARRHMLWIKEQAVPGSTSLEEYENCRYEIGEDGMISKMAADPNKKRRQSVVSKQSTSSDAHIPKKSRSASANIVVPVMVPQQDADAFDRCLDEDWPGQLTMDIIRTAYPEVAFGLGPLKGSTLETEPLANNQAKSKTWSRYPPPSDAVPSGPNDGVPSQDHSNQQASSSGGAPSGNNNSVQSRDSLNQQVPHAGTPHNGANNPVASPDNSNQQGPQVIPGDLPDDPFNHERDLTATENWPVWLVNTRGPLERNTTYFQHFMEDAGVPPSAVSQNATGLAPLSRNTRSRTLTPGPGGHVNDSTPVDPELMADGQIFPWLEAHHAVDTAPTEFLEDGKRIGTAGNGWKDSKHTHLLPAFMAVDAHRPKNVMTSLPVPTSADINMSVPFSVCLPVGQMYGGAGSRYESDLRQPTMGQVYCLDADKLYVFYHAPTTQDPPFVYFAFRKRQGINEQDLLYYPVSWYPEAKQCSTERGRKRFLDGFMKSCNALVQSRNTILRDEMHINLIRSRRSQLEFCLMEFDRGNRTLFRPLFGGSKDIEAALQWIDEQQRREILANDRTISAFSVTCGPVRWFPDTKHPPYHCISSIRRLLDVCPQAMSTLDNVVVPYVRNPEVSSFVVLGVYKWLWNSKLRVGRLCPDVNNITVNEVIFVLKLFACATIYVVERQSDSSRDLFNTWYSATRDFPAEQSICCAQLADTWSSEIQALIPILLKQVEKPHAVVDGILLNHNIVINPAANSPAKQTLGTVLSSLVFVNLPQDLQHGQLSCNDNLEELAGKIARTVNAQPESADFVHGYLHQHPMWLNGLFGCTRSIYTQLPGYEANKDMMHPGLRGRSLDDAITQDLEKRIEDDRRAYDENLAALRGPFAKYALRSEYDV